jgi:serine/threonine protein kinase
MPRLPLVLSLAHSCISSFLQAPELLKYNYSSPADIWSIGVVSYILLTGYPPFNGDTDAEIHASILRGNVKFPSDMGWPSKSVLCLDFIECLLQKDPTRRLTAQDALLHPWILQYDEIMMMHRWSAMTINYRVIITSLSRILLGPHCPMAWGHD